MTVLMGPVLTLLDAGAEAWRLGVLVVADAPPADLRWNQAGRQASAAPEKLWARSRQVAYGFRFTVALPVQPATFSYEVEGLAFTVALPAQAASPTMAYASCNGFSDPKLMKSVDQNDRMWRALAARHAQTPLHLLLMGGDQVYADDLWRDIPEMRAFARAEFSQANTMPCPPALVRRLEAFYFDLYVQHWSQPDVAAMLAAVPTLMMWDDHDIVDGWGSYPPERQTCPMFREGIGPAATKAFQVFQKQQPAGTPPAGSLFPGSFSQGFTIGQVGILALDMRSERTIDQVLSPGHWRAVYDWMDGLDGIGHLLVMSSIPLVYPSLRALEDLVVAFPGRQDLEDDLRDRWSSDGHRVERLRLVRRLLDLAAERAIRPTFLSGDVHVAALASIVSLLHRDRAGTPLVLFELISSAIVHPYPGPTVLFALNVLAGIDEALDTGITGRIETFPAAARRFIGARNVLTVEPDLDRERPRLWANLWVENGVDEPRLLTKVVEPLPLAPVGAARTA